MRHDLGVVSRDEDAVDDGSPGHDPRAARGHCLRGRPFILVLLSSFLFIRTAQHCPQLLAFFCNLAGLGGLLLLAAFIWSLKQHTPAARALAGARDYT